VNALPTILQNKMTIVIIYNSRKDTSNDGKEIGKKKTRKWRRHSNIFLPTSMFPKWQFACLFVLSSLLLLPVAMELPFGIQALVPFAGRPKQQQQTGNRLSPSWQHGNVAWKMTGSDLAWLLHANSKESMDDFSSAGGIGDNDDDNDDTQQNAKRKKYSFGRFGGRKRTTVHIPQTKKNSTSWLPGALVAAGLVLWALLPGSDTAMNSPHDYYYYSYSYSSNTVYNGGAKTLENVQSNLQTNIPKNYLVLTEPATRSSTSSSSSNLQQQQQRPEQQQLPPRLPPLAPATDRDIKRMLDQQLPQEFQDEEAMMMMMQNVFRSIERIMDES
jgi:hypothetical protein